MPHTIAVDPRCLDDLQPAARLELPQQTIPTLAAGVAAGSVPANSKYNEGVSMPVGPLRSGMPLDTEEPTPVRFCGRVLGPVDE